MRRPAAIVLALLGIACGDGESATDPEPVRPNVILIFTDDLGYADLGAYGSTTIETPHLDAMAASGVRFTQGYVGNSVCTPSRAVLLTGRFGPRQVLPGTQGGVYWPFSTEGMTPEQVTFAEMLRDAGYTTALVGKWHLGHAPGFLPVDQGFDRFFGLPYSNDMDPLPLMEGRDTLDSLETVELLVTRLPSDSKQATLTEQYTDRAVELIQEAHDNEQPFFLYYANNFPHTPLAASPRFEGTSTSCDEASAERSCGLYADVVREIDWSVGEILTTLRDLDIEDETIVVFTSDNGPWLLHGRDGGSAGLLREGKSTTFEGGYRVPMIAQWKGTYREGAVETTPMVVTDWMATVAGETGASLPDDRTMDGFDLGPLLRGEGPRDPSGEPFRLVYYRGDNATPGAYREGRFKYKAPVVDGESIYALYDHGELLFDLEADPSEENDLAGARPDLVDQLRTAMEAADAEFKADAPQ